MSPSRAFTPKYRPASLPVIVAITTVAPAGLVIMTTSSPVPVKTVGGLGLAASAAALALAAAAALRLAAAASLLLASAEALAAERRASAAASRLCWAVALAAAWRSASDSPQADSVRQ